MTGERGHDHQLGELSARVRILEDGHLRLERRIEERLDELSNKVGTIHDQLTAAGGSWRTLVVLGVMVSGITGIAVAVYKLITGR